MYALQLTQPCNELQTFFPMELVALYSVFMVYGADPGFSKGEFKFVSDKLGGSVGMLPQENLKIWNVGDAISRAFRVNLP